MGLVHAGVGGDVGNSFGLFLDALHVGLVAIDQDDGNVSAVYVILPADNNDVAFHHPRFHRAEAMRLFTQADASSSCFRDTDLHLEFQ